MIYGFVVDDGDYGFFSYHDKASTDEVQCEIATQLGLPDEARVRVLGCAECMLYNQYRGLAFLTTERP